MEIKIGIKNVNREISLETAESSESVEKSLRLALEEDGVLALTDDKGRKVLIPARQIGYVDLGQEHQRPVGFGTV
ncbi:MAG TPA: DUF3107 domain-containing protein [Propionibacteriaceae bacterium]|nr:DUF3107 domain-containing protein [Propionibacteriaceae bacterium]